MLSHESNFPLTTVEKAAKPKLTYLRFSYPQFGVDQPGDPSAVLPFGMPITNFRAGNVIAIFRAAALFGNETFTPVWDQQKHELTIWVTNSLHPGTTSPIAVFTLQGEYAPNDFQATFDGSTRPTQIDITTTNNWPRTPLH